VALEGDSDGVPSGGRGPLPLLHSERRVDTMGCAAPALPKMASEEAGRARQRHRPPAGSGGGGGVGSACAVAWSIVSREPRVGFA
jgi:hypothetical protein